MRESVSSICNVLVSYSFGFLLFFLSSTQANQKLMVEDMNLSHLVHSHQRSRVPSSTHYHPSCFPPAPGASRVPSDRVMASVLTANPYLSQPPVFVGAPQHPPSPPVEELNRQYTLPSIQSLIGAMAESPSADSTRQCRSTP